MRKLLVGMAVIVVAVSGLMGQDTNGKNESRNATDEKILNLIELGSGVYNIKKDKNNKLESLIVVGKTRISTVIGAQKGIEIAERRAEANAFEKFSSWMQTNVHAIQRVGSDSEIILKGNGDTIKEEGKDTERTTHITETETKGLIRGLKKIHVKQDSKGEMCIIFGWSAEDVNLAIEASKINKNGKESGDSDNKISRKIEDKTVKSSEADKFYNQGKQ